MTTPTEAGAGFIVYVGEEPEPRTIEELVAAFRRDTGITFPSGTGIRLMGAPPGAREPDEDLALALAARLEGEGKLARGSLERLIIRATVIGGARYLVVAVVDEAESARRREQASDRPNAESGFIVYSGEEPEPRTIEELVAAFRRDTGVNLPSGTGMRLIGFRPGGTQPSPDVALALAARMEEKGQLPPGSLERVVSNAQMIDGARFVVAAIVDRESGDRQHRHERVRNVLGQASTTDTRPHREPGDAAGENAAPDTGERGRQRPRWPASWLARLRPRRGRPAEHLVYSLRAGMDRATVLGLLGEPSKSITDEEVFGTSNAIVVGDVKTGGEYWLYEHVPPGHDTRVVVRHGRLESVEIDAGPSAPAGQRVTRIDETGVHPG